MKDNIYKKIDQMVAQKGKIPSDMYQLKKAVIVAELVKKNKGSVEVLNNIIDAVNKM